MRSLTIITLLLVSLTACYENSDSRIVTEEKPFLEKEIIEEDTIEEHTLPKQLIPEILQKTDDLNFPLIELPYQLKAGALDTMRNHGELSTKQLDFLSSNYREIKEQDDYYLKETKRIYKLKKNGTYQEYVDGLDLAQLKDATAHSIGMVDLDTALIMLWSLEYSSFEACPFYSGKELWVSLIQNDSVQSSALIASEDSGGDPPAFGETLSKIEINSELEVTVESTNNTYEDEDLVESRKTSRSFNIRK